MTESDSDEKLNKFVQQLRDRGWSEDDIDSLMKSSSLYPSENEGFYVNGNPQYLELSRYFKYEKSLITFEHDSYIFNGKYYERLGNLGLSNLIIEATQEKVKPKHLEDFKKHLKAFTFVKNVNNMLPSSDLINLDNGILNIKTKELFPHSKEYFFKNVVPVSYGPKATAPRWVSFLNEVLFQDQDTIELLQEIFGYILLGGPPFLHRAFILFGEGRNGKGTVLHILRSILGEENCSNVDITKLDDPFSVVQLDGRKANITGELTTRLMASESFKTAVAGEPLEAAQKFKPSYNLHVQARFIFSTNKLPKFDDDSTGLEERLVILPFLKFIPDEQRDFALADKLEKELPGILNWAIEGLSRVLRRGKLRSEPEAVIKQKNQYKADSNSVWGFCLDHLIVKEFRGVENQISCTVDELYASYKNYCDNDNLKAVSKPVFGKRLKKYLDQFDQVEKLRTRHESGRYQIYKNVYCSEPSFQKLNRFI